MASHSAPELLSDQINKTTRTSHTQLNRLITSRLPLCLPPYTANPDVYAVGFAHFAQIYLSFEAVWDDVTTMHASDLGTSGPDRDFSCTRRIDDRLLSNNEQWHPILALLASVRPPGILRSERIKHDLSTLLRVPHESVPSHLQALSSSSPILVAFSSHVRSRVGEKPHILLAYAWVMYMAIFSGGRYIRAQLRTSGQDFWSRADAEIADSIETQTGLQALPLSFWCHGGEHDGEDVKSEFKARLAGAETFLSTEQRNEIVTEASYIFDLCLSLVQELELSIPMVFDVFDDRGSKPVGQLAAQPWGTSTITTTSPLSKQELRNMRWSVSSVSFWATTALTLGTGIFTWLARDQRVPEALKF